MKSIYFFVLLPLVFNYNKVNSQVVAVGDVHTYLDKMIIVYGKVAEANFDRTKKNDTTIIVLNDSAGRGKITLTIDPLVRAKFGYRPELVLIDKKIYVSGTVTWYNNHYQINITSPFDISFSPKRADVAPVTDNMTPQVAAAIIDKKPAAPPRAVRATVAESKPTTANIEEQFVAANSLQGPTKIKQSKKKRTIEIKKSAPNIEEPLVIAPAVAAPAKVEKSKSNGNAESKPLPANNGQPIVNAPAAPAPAQVQQPERKDTYVAKLIIARTNIVAEPEAAKPARVAKKRSMKTEPQKIKVNETFAVVEITAVVDSSSMKRGRNKEGKKAADNPVSAPAANDRQAGNGRNIKSNKLVQQEATPPNITASVENNGDTATAASGQFYVPGRPVNPIIGEEFMTQKTLNLYSGPGNFFTKNVTIKKGLRVKVASVSFEWAKIVTVTPVEGEIVEGYTLLKNLIGN